MFTLSTLKKRLLLLTLCLSTIYSTNTYASTLDCNTAVNIGVPAHECQALLDLYDSTNGASRNFSDDRDTDSNVDSWYGVDTDGINVIGLSLANNNLSGTLPSSLSGLASLVFLYAESNQLQGTLPSSRSTLSLLQEINLSHNELSGVLPDSRSSRTSMGQFNVRDNNLEGPLPSSRSTWTNIYYIRLGDNQFEGSFPSSRSAWTNMSYFYAENNQLQGTLPSSRSSWTSMWLFNVAGNQLVGTLPSSRSAWTFLRYLYTQNNFLSGPLPSTRSSWINIFDFDVSNNFLSGSLPSTWYPARPNRGVVYIQSDNNCMQNTGYSVGMQGRLSINALITPQNDCTVVPPVILTPTSGQVFTTGSITISGTGQSGNIISVTISGTTLTGTINSTGLRSILFNGMADGSYTANVFQTHYLSTYNSNTVTRNFSIAIPLPPAPTPTPTPSGGGGGGGVSLKKDDCPAGDNSASYYDKDCGKASTTNTSGTTDQTISIIKQCQYNDGEFELFKTTMTDIKGKPYEQAVITLLNNCLIHGEASKGTSYKGEEALRYGALYKIVYRLVGKPIEIPATQKHRSDIYYTEGKKLGLREGLSTPKDPNTLVGGRALQKVIHNILNYRSLNNAELETSLKGKTYNSLLITRGKFALVIAKLINYSK